MDKLSDLLKIAKQAAQTSGNFLKNEFHQDQEASLNKGRDIKLKIDIESEKLILEFINQNSKLPILSEESGASSDLGDTYWIVDPLDGSSNYFRKINICAVSIALMHQGEPLVGVINDFMSEHLYFASKNGGAFCNDTPIKVSDIEDAAEGTIMTGIPAKSLYSDDEFKSMIELFQKWKKVRMIGSAAIANLYVAKGKADCYEEKGTFIWDVAAGAVIVHEAGGFASLSEFKSDFRVDAKFTNGKVD
jgi:myo-inositol-1(or 4)-monophosphatase